MIPLSQNGRGVRVKQVKPDCHLFRWQPGFRAVASFLLEEGCHSAGFVTTIHVRHHLLLSIGWQARLTNPRAVAEVCHISIRMSIGEIRFSQNCNNVKLHPCSRKFMIPFESLRQTIAAML